MLSPDRNEYPFCTCTQQKDSSEEQESATKYYFPFSTATIKSLSIGIFTIKVSSTGWAAV